MDASSVGCVFLLFPDNENGSHVGRLEKKRSSLFYGWIPEVVVVLLTGVYP
jgi:hypothetical protein